MERFKGPSKDDLCRGWLQEESSRAREMVSWFRENGITDIDEWLSTKRGESK